MADEKLKVRKVKQVSMREHILKRSMWAGSKSVQTIESYVVQERKKDDGSNDKEYIFVSEDLKYPPVLLKLVDEIIVNAVDHHSIYPKQVSKIDVEFSDDGYITVLNNGPGIIVEKTKNIQGVEVYTPQMIFSEFLTGSNLDDTEEKERTTGGQNGLGSKIVSVFSDEFTVETTDETNKVFYTQTFKNGLLEIGEPTIVDLKDKKAASKLEKYQLSGHTKIKFLPTYKEFKLTNKGFHETFYKLIQSRCWQAAACVSAKVSFNKKPIEVNSFTEVCQMFTEFEIFPTKMINSITNKHPWDICIGLTEGKEKHISFVNGLIVGKGGTHIQYIQKQLVDNLKEKVEKEIKKSGVKFNKNLLLNNIFIFMRGAIPNPELGGQTKDTVNNPIEQYSGYKLPETHWIKIWNLVQSSILATFLKKQLGDVKLRANRGKIDVPKYKEASFCRNSKRCHECGLIITEGDSATGTANTGLLAKVSPDFNYQFYGTYSIQGVMMNGLKESIELGKSKVKSKTAKRIPNKKVVSNERISSLIKVLGLDYNKTYDLTDVGEKEWATLRYGFIAGLTDQDLDGFNIFGLLCTFFMTYWPALVKRGFIRRINTPIVRAYPKPGNKSNKFVKEFYTEKEAKAWVEEIGEEVAKKNYDFKYYKGLASHVENKVKKEVSQMFRRIDNKICTYILDAAAIEAMYVFYGDDTAPRKVALSTPVDLEPVDGLKIPLSQHFQIDTKLYQRDNIIRKLLNAIDGFVTSRRKVFFTARKVGHKDIKVAGLASEVVNKANYHHGEVSLEQTIVRMAQAYPGARNLPLLLPIGNFGSRGNGYKDYGASRYIYTTINHKLADKLFRREDEFILEYEVEDGERFEPKYYVPIIPYVLCETNELPATGWAISTHARDLTAVLKNVRDMISGKITKCGKLPISRKDFHGDIRKHKNRDYFVGSYEYDEKDNAVTITELPPGNYANTYLKGPDESIKKKAASEEKKGILGKEFIDDYDDNTTLDGVNIKLYLKPGAFDEISSKYGNETFDCFEEYLELKEPIYHRINLINEKGEVVEYKSYEQVFDDWFNFRKELYVVRIEREIILNNLEIEMLLNMQRFSQEHDTYAITSKTSLSKISEIAAANKYKIFNKTLLDNPKYTTIKELVKLITSEEHGASYDYLISMGYKAINKEAQEARAKKIEELKERQKYLLDDSGAFKGAKIWEYELNELSDSIEKGLATEWCYDAKECLFEDGDITNGNINDTDVGAKTNKRKSTKGATRGRGRGRSRGKSSE
jgi:DNA topoisomerase-2